MKISKVGKRLINREINRELHNGFNAIIVKRLNLFFVGITLQKFNIKYVIATLIDYTVRSTECKITMWVSLLVFIKIMRGYVDYITRTWII